MKWICPNCRQPVRLTKTQHLVEHTTKFGAPCRLAGASMVAAFGEHLDGLDRVVGGDGRNAAPATNRGVS